MNKPQQDPRLFVAFGVLTLIAGGAGLFWLFSGLNEQRGVVAELETKVVEQREVPRRLADSATLLASVKRQLAHLEGDVTTSEYLPTLLNELETAGGDCGLVVTGVRPVITRESGKTKEFAKRPPYDIRDIEVRGRGTYGAILKFIDVLDKFPKIVEARAVSIEPYKASRDLPGEFPLQMSVRLRAYVFPEVAKKKPAVTTAQRGGSHVG